MKGFSTNCLPVTDRDTTEPALKTSSPSPGQTQQRVGSAGVCACDVPAHLLTSTGFMSWHSGLLSPVTGTNSTLGKSCFCPHCPYCPALAPSLKTPLLASHQQARPSAHQTGLRHLPGGPRVGTMSRESLEPERRGWRHLRI